MAKKTRNKKEAVNQVDKLVSIVQKHRNSLYDTQVLVEALLSDISESVEGLDTAIADLKSASRSIQDANDYLRRTV